MNLFEGQPVAQTPLEVLCKRLHGRSKAMAVLNELSLEFGLRIQTGLDGPVPDQALSAVALLRLGMTPESVSSLLTWQQFEGFCADLLRAHGYSVTTNIILTKPRRQIDILAEASTMALCIDCKHWGRSFSSSSIERVASDQLERTSHFKEKRSFKSPILPVVLTLVDSQVRTVLGVPVVPIFALGDFLASVTRFDPGLCVL